MTLMLGSALGGAVAAGVNKYAPITNPMIKNVIPLGLGFLLGSSAKAKPLMIGAGCGMIGAGSNLLVAGLLDGTGIGETEFIPDSVLFETLGGALQLNDDEMDQLAGVQDFEASVSGVQDFEASVSGLDDPDDFISENEIPY